MKPYTQVFMYTVVFFMYNGIGADTQTRTENQLITGQLRYQLRHISILNNAVLQTPFNYDYQSITTGSTGK